MARHVCGLFLAGLMMSSAVAAEWPGGASFVIPSTDSITNGAARGAISHFIDNGALTFLPGASVTLTGNVVTAVGSGAGESGTFDLLGGSVTGQGAGQFIVGNMGGTGSMLIANGALLRMNTGYFAIAKNGENSRDLPAFGEVTVAGTLVVTNRLEFTGYFPNNAPQPSYPVSARLTLETDGVVEAGEIYKNDHAASELIFNGGTLRAIRNHTSFIGGVGVMDIIIADGTAAVFDTAGRDITIRPNADPLYADALTLRGETSVGDGGLTKTGAGTLAFRLPPARNTFTGAVTVAAGTLDLGRPLAANQTVTVHPGANFIPQLTDNLAQITWLGDPGERRVYTVAADTGSLDLTALTAHFYDDRLAGPLAGEPVYLLCNALTHTAGDTAATPFRLIGNGGTLNITNTGLEAAYLQLEGPGTFNFLGSRAYTTNGTLALAGGGYRQSGAFSIETPAGDAPLSLALTNGRFNVDTRLNVGGLGGGHFAADGATVTLGNLRVGDTEGVTGTLTQSAGTVTVQNAGDGAIIGANGGYGELIITGGQFTVNNNIRVASNPDGNTGFRPHGLIAVSNALFRCNGLYFSSWWPNTGTAKNFHAGELRLLPGGIADVNFLEKNDDPTSTVHFAGGTLRARADRSPFITAGHVHGTLNLTAADGHLIDIDTQSYTVTMTSHPGAVNLTGPGGFRKQGTGTFASSPDSADYAGDTLIDAGTLLVGGGSAIPHGPGKGNVRIAPGATLDVTGTHQTVNRLTGAGRVTSADTTGTLGVLADGSSDTWTRAWLTGHASLAKHGPGTLTLAAANAVPGNLTIHAGHVRVEPFSGYTHYRFKVEGLKGGDPTPNSMQISEFALHNGERNITQDRAGIAYDTAYTDTVPNNQTFPAGEAPGNAVDGSLTTKWLDFRAAPTRSATDRDRVWLSITYDTPQWVTRYNWAKANDNHPRDPADWRLQGGYDGQTWSDLHTVTGHVAPNVFNAWVKPESEGFPVTLTQNTLSDTGLVTVHAGAALTLAAGPETIGGLAGTGTVTLDNAALTLAPPAGMSNVFSGTLTGTGALAKDGPGTQYLHGASTFTGPLTVRAGTLAIQKLDTHRWFRYTVQEIRAPTNAVQFSELALYSADGQRRNLLLTPGTLDALQPGQFSPSAAYPVGNNEGIDKLFDGSTGSKCCLTGTSPLLTAPSTWRTVTMRLADDTPEITGYNLSTANDVPDRDPVAWTLEGSADGINWHDLAVCIGVTPPDAGERGTYYNGGTPYGLATRAMEFGTPGADSDAIPAGSTVEVHAGATLDIVLNETINALRVDMQNAGTITRLIPAPNGILHIVNAAGQSPSGLLLPLIIGTIENPAHLRTWAIYIDGEPLTGYTLGIAADGRLYLKSNGTLLMLN